MIKYRYIENVRSNVFCIDLHFFGFKILDSKTICCSIQSFFEISCCIEVNSRHDCLLDYCITAVIDVHLPMRAVLR